MTDRDICTSMHTLFICLMMHAHTFVIDAELSDNASVNWANVACSCCMNNCSWRKVRAKSIISKRFPSVFDSIVSLYIFCKYSVFGFHNFYPGEMISSWCFWPRTIALFTIKYYKSENINFKNKSHVTNVIFVLTNIKKRKT